MDSNVATVREFRYDVFISYSRKDSAFARRLEQELSHYRPPKDLPVPQRYLRVFRDEADFTGGEYHQSLDRNLQDAAKLIVLCSPNHCAGRGIFILRVDGTGAMPELPSRDQRENGG